jgi:hypothetical protein
MFTQHGIVPAVGDQKIADEFEKMINYTLSEHEKKYYIGHMLLNINRLQQTYKSMKYDEEGAIKKDFSLWDYIGKIWEDVNDAGGNNHDFKITSDLERPNIVRVVDMRYQESVNLKQEDIIELNIQSNDSIVRDFSFNTSIPSAMSATIAIAAQAPKNVNSLEAASFGAFHQNISNRFATFSEPEEPTGPTEEEIVLLEQNFKTDMRTYSSGLKDLSKHMDAIFQGGFMVAADGGDTLKSEEVGKYKGLVNAVRRASENLIKMYPKTENGNFKGQPIPKPSTSATSAIIPLKFNATLDGISGIIIGNVFKLPDSRLPRGYKKANIAFVVMTEDQTITSGQDWTTKITGQMIILPKKGVSGGGTGDGWEGIDYNQFNEEADTTKQYNKGESISAEQGAIDPGMNKVRVGSKVYLKINDDYSHVRSGAVIDNESSYGRWDDNIIGLFQTSRKGKYLGKVIATTSTATYASIPEHKDANGNTVKEKWYRALADGNPDKNKPVSESIIENEGWPWYKISFGENAQKRFKQGWLWDAPNNSLDKGGADKGALWNDSKTGWMRLDVLMSSNKGTKYGPEGTFAEEDK